MRNMLLNSPVLWLACLLALSRNAYGNDVYTENAGDEIKTQNDAIRRKRSDDVSLVALQAVVQQQAAVVQQLQADMTAVQADLATTKNELSAAQSQLLATQSQLDTATSELATIKQSLPSTFTPVAFSVKFSHDSQSGLALSNHATLVFDNAIVNIGNAYNVHTGVFTAPVAGVYSFYISFMSPNGHSHTYIDIVKDGDFLDYAFANGGDDHDQGSTEVVVHLAKGEQVWARHRQGDGVRGSSFTIFTGYLVQAD